MKKTVFIVLFVLLVIFFLPAQASQSEISKMEKELTAFSVDLTKVENNRYKLDLQKEMMLDIFQMQYKNLSEFLNLAKKGDKDITDQSIRGMRLVLEQHHALLKQMFEDILKK